MTSTGRPARGRSRCQRPRGSAAVLTGWRRTVRRRVGLSSFGGDSYLPVLRPMRTQDVGWHRLRGFLTGVRGYVGAGAGLHWQHLAEAAGARPIVDAAAATASAPRRNRLMFFSLLITPAF